MVEFCPLFSSSSGNCVYIGGEGGGVLVDAGVSAKQAELALWDIGVDAESIRAVFVTHEHSDHVRGLRVFAKRHKLPVWATAGTLAALEEAGIADGSFECRVVPPGGAEAAGFLFETFRTSHDVRESCGYRITLPDGRGAAIATDLGLVTPEVLGALTGCELVMLESNHDVEMLRSGAYPYWLKQRILSDEGHLSNEVCAQTAARLVRSGVSQLILGHLSKENNHPDLAYEHTNAALLAIGARVGTDCALSVAGVRVHPPDGIHYIGGER
ncbi:MAG: MBL fold metallo-hydrolase [Oscillospiraceae bacterium]|jgi:phosphoribosyl 1,2-cyclic phosphodiesterase|nr:MBL fold metallo-hydrolase [Oscillospiraceae bacterium]